VLGELNDATVAMRTLPRLTTSRALLAYAHSWHAAWEQPRVLDAEARLLRLLLSQRPWQRSRPGPGESGTDAPLKSCR
jgi:hypothetical protein